jgi:hypothetical protein
MVFTRQCSQPAWPRGSFPRKSLAKPVEHAARFNPYYPDGMGVSVPPVADHLPEQPGCPTWDNPKESFRATIARSAPQIVPAAGKIHKRYFPLATFTGYNLVRNHPPD